LKKRKNQENEKCMKIQKRDPKSDRESPSSAGHMVSHQRRV